MGDDKDFPDLPCNELDESLSFLPNTGVGSDNEVQKLAQRDKRFDSAEIIKLRQDIEQGAFPFAVFFFVYINVFFFVYE